MRPHAATDLGQGRAKPGVGDVPGQRRLIQIGGAEHRLGRLQHPAGVVKDTDCQQRRGLGDEAIPDAEIAQQLHAGGKQRGGAQIGRRRPGPHHQRHLGAIPGQRQRRRHACDAAANHGDRDGFCTGGLLRHCRANMPATACLSMRQADGIRCSTGGLGPLPFCRGGLRPPSCSGLVAGGRPQAAPTNRGQCPSHAFRRKINGLTSLLPNPKIPARPPRNDSFFYRVLSPRELNGP